MPLIWRLLGSLGRQFWIWPFVPRIPSQEKHDKSLGVSTFFVVLWIYLRPGALAVERDEFFWSFAQHLRDLCTLWLMVVKFGDAMLPFGCYNYVVTFDHHLWTTCGVASLGGCFKLIFGWHFSFSSMVDMRGNPQEWFFHGLKRQANLRSKISRWNLQHPQIDKKARQTQLHALYAFNCLVSNIISENWTPFFFHWLSLSRMIFRSFWRISIF